MKLVVEEYQDNARASVLCSKSNLFQEGVFDRCTNYAMTVDAVFGLKDNPGAGVKLGTIHPKQINHYDDVYAMYAASLFFKDRRVRFYKSLNKPDFNRYRRITITEIKL